MVFCVKVACDNELLLTTLGLDARDFAVPDQDYIYLTPEQRAREGQHKLVSANMWNLKDTRAIHKIFFEHPIFGTQCSAVS